MRGRIHQIFSVIAVPAFVYLVLQAHSPTVRAALIVYACGVTAMLSVSGIYHSGKLGESKKRLFKRFDHMTILLAIAGSYTAVTVLALSGTSEKTLLIFGWSATIVGVIIRMSWLFAPSYVTAGVYVVVGWSAMIEIGPLTSALGGGNIALLCVGGGLYTGGALIYALKKPNPWPTVFGFHEIFHTLVVIAASVHYVLVLRLLK